MSWFLGAAIKSIVISLTGVALASFVLRRRFAESKKTRCGKCGYILRGITEPRCPECGERV